jgi:lipopolysaccharide transport system permease protein
MGGQGGVTSRVTESEHWTENRPTQGWRSLDLGELWRYRELVAFLALRDVKVRYKQAVFGGLWAIVQPLAGAAIFTVVFGRLAKLPSDGMPYLIFAYAGFTLWSYASTAVNNARSSLVTNSALITKVYFPRLAAPLAGVLPGLLDLGVSLLLLAAMLVWAGLAPGIAIVATPLILLGTTIVVFGVGALFAALTVQYRDVEQIFGLLLQLWLFATPVAYPSSLIPAPWRWLYHLNPMVGLVDAWRWALVAAPRPGPEALVSAAVAVLLLLIGLRVFQQSERRFADVI